MLGAFGWRALFQALAAASVAVAALIFLLVPEKALPGQGQTLRAQIAGFGRIFSAIAFWRIALPLVVCHAVYQAMQGLWLAPWLYDVAGYARPAVAGALFTAAVAYTAGSVFFGISGDRLAQAGISRMTTYKVGVLVSLAMFVILAAGVITTGLSPVLAVYAFTSISVSLAYALLTPLFPPEMTGRVITASNVLMFGTSFLFQWGIGAVLRLFPADGERYAGAGYATAFWILVAMQAAVVLWLLPMRGREAD